MSPVVFRPTAALLLLTGAPVSSPLAAQITQIARRPIAEITQITFGSLCEDRFVIRNDGSNPVALEYKVSKGTEMTSVRLEGRELIELESPSKEPVELWIDGKLVAKAEKERRKCSDVQGSATVAVAPLEVGSLSDRERDRDRDRAQSLLMAQRMQFGVGVGFGNPWFDPWWGPYGGYGFGFRPFYSGFYGVPIIIGGGRASRR
jgi:hypothetical protein